MRRGKLTKSALTSNSELEGMTVTTQGINIEDNKMFYFVSDTKNKKERKIDRTMTIEF